MENLKNEETSIIWKFPYMQGNCAKIIFECPCGVENEMIDINRQDTLDKTNSWDIVINTPIESSISFMCDGCKGKLTIKHRAYNDKEEIKNRERIINNLLY